MSTANSQSDADNIGSFNSLEESKSQVYTIVEPTMEPLALNASISIDQGTAPLAEYIEVTKQDETSFEFIHGTDETKNFQCSFVVQ